MNLVSEHTTIQFPLILFEKHRMELFILRIFERVRKPFIKQLQKIEQFSILATPPYLSKFLVRFTSPRNEDYPKFYMLKLCPQTNFLS